MGYSAEVISRARQRLESQRADKESLMTARQREVYEKLPRVQQIDKLMIRNMALAVGSSFGPDANGPEVMEAARAQNRVLAQERQQLLDANFPAGYLDETPVCPKCSGLGWIGTAMCSCLEELCRQEQRRELSLLSCGPASFAGFRLDVYPDRDDPATGFNIRKVMEKTAQTCVQYAREFGENAPNLLLSGGTGLGKTFLSACIAEEVTRKGFSVAYESAPHLFTCLEKARFSEDPLIRQEAQRKADKYTQCDLMIVDDLGTEMGGQFVTAVLYTLINDRLLAGKATIISTNLTNDELEKRYSPQILSRLRGNYRRLPFLGDDIRLLRNRGY